MRSLKVTYKLKVVHFLNRLKIYMEINFIGSKFHAGDILRASNNVGSHFIAKV